MQQKEKKYFGMPSEGALNADDAAFAVSPNQWINAENIRSGSTDKGVTGVIESIGSTKLISQPQPSVTYIEIGSITDESNNRFCYFKYNTTGNNDKIVCYDSRDNIEYDVLLSSQITGGLNFSSESIIHSAKIINGLLYWPDSTNNQPRKINIDAAILANYPSYIPYQKNVVPYIYPLNFSEITIIKPTEIKEPFIEKGIDVSFPISLIYNQSFQFAWQYIYYDNEATVMSIYSRASFLNGKNDTYNYIEIAMYNLEQIPSTVRIVNLICRVQDGTVTGGNNAFTIKTWDKEINADALEIANQNANISPLQYSFYNTSLGNGIAAIDVLRPFDNVPIYSESLESAKDRILSANNTEGYDTPKITSIQLSAQKTTYGYPTDKVSCFVGNAPYLGGTIFLDFAMRRCAVVTNSGAVIVTDPLVLGNLGTGPNSFSVTSFIQWQLSNTNALTEIPDWAYYYIPVLTFNQRTRFFVSAFQEGDLLRYVVRNGDGTYTYTNGTFPADCYGIALNSKELVANGLGYVYTAGDVCTFIMNFNTGPGSTITKNVIAQDGVYIIIQPQDIGNIGSNFNYGYYEIYTPYVASTQEPYYDNGFIYNINNPGTLSRNYSTTFGNFYPDSFVLLRNPAASLINGIYGSAMSPNDNFYKRWDTNISRSNFVSNLGQVKKTQYTSWSDTFIPNTSVNGLSTFRVGNEVSVPENCGAIRKLQLTSKISNPKEGDVMLSICENETNSMYLGETQITDSTGTTQFFSSATDVIGTINTLKGSSGTINPESVYEYRGQVWWGDAINGRWTQYSENGLFFISSLKMVRFWKNWFLQYNSMNASQIEALGGRPFLFSIVDPAHDELLISIPKLSNIPPKGYLPDYPSTIYPFDILDLQGKTIVYKLDQTGAPAHWQGAYSFNPEGFAILNNQLYAFKNGLLYIHNQTTLYNNFYGAQYKSRIMFVSNMFPSTPKVYNNIALEVNARPTLTYFYNSHPEQQASDLVDFDYKQLEGVDYATIYRNKLTPTFSGFTTNALLNGDKMRNIAMFILLEFSINNVPLELRFVQLGFIGSVGQII